VTTPCDGKCQCVDACPSCPTRAGWLGQAVPVYAVEEFGEEWIRARAATVPFRIPFSDRRAARRHALPQSESVQPDPAAQRPEAQGTHHHNEASKRGER
jgi:hypothetical protein